MMSKSRHSRRLLGLVFAMAALGLLGVAVPAAAVTVVPINAGNGAYVAGTVTVSNNGSTVTVTYETSSGDTAGLDWKLVETHLDVECDPSAFPTTRSGNPQIGRFEYRTDHNPPVDVFTYTVQAPAGCAVPCEDSIVLAAHAALVAYNPTTGAEVREETGWGQGTDFPGNNWAMWFEAPLGGSVIKVASARWRSFANTTSTELLVGRGSLANAPNRSEAQYTWLRPGTYDVTFTYDRSTLKLIATIEPGGGYVEFLLTQPLARMDSFEVILTDRDTNSQVDVGNVTVDGLPVGSFVGDGTQHIYAFPSTVLDDGFTFTGTITISGNFSSTPERSKVEIFVGRCLVGG